MGQIIKGLRRLITAIKWGGTAIDYNFGVLADRIGPCKYDATVDPGVNDDSAHGYYVGSRWINISIGLMYDCIVETPGAAIWRLTGLFSYSTGLVSLRSDLFSAANVSVELKTKGAGGISARRTTNAGAALTYGIGSYSVDLGLAKSGAGHAVPGSYSTVLAGSDNYVGGSYCGVISSSSTSVDSNSVYFFVSACFNGSFSNCQYSFASGLYAPLISLCTYVHVSATYGAYLSDTTNTLMIASSSVQIYTSTNCSVFCSSNGLLSSCGNVRVQAFEFVIDSYQNVDVFGYRPQPRVNSSRVLSYSNWDDRGTSQIHDIHLTAIAPASGTVLLVADTGDFANSRIKMAPYTAMIVEALIIGQSVVSDTVCSFILKATLSCVTGTARVVTQAYETLVNEVGASVPFITVSTNYFDINVSGGSNAVIYTAYVRIAETGKVLTGGSS